VSVCIANYNGIGLIDACIESVRKQNTTFPLEIIVHDDASSDDSVAHIQARHPDVTLLQSDENVGFCIANNRMAAIAAGEYLLLLNNDATLMPGALKELYAEAGRSDRAAVLGIPQYEDSTGKLLDIGSMLDPFLNPVPNRDPKRKKVGMVMGACLWVPASVWHALDGFPEWFGSIGEDLYLCCAARVTGHPVRVIAVSGYRHQVGQSFGGGKVTPKQRLLTTMNRRALSERNKTFTLVATYPTALLTFALPIHLILLLLEGALLSLIQRRFQLWATIYAPVVPSLLRERDKLLQARRRIQKRRAISTAEFLSPVRWLPRKLEMLWRHGLPDVR
jgi:GT2 family glycosyltransferase